MSCLQGAVGRVLEGGRKDRRSLCDHGEFAGSQRKIPRDVAASFGRVGSGREVLAGYDCE
jgi:hypothetical protein